MHQLFRYIKVFYFLLILVISYTATAQEITNNQQNQIYIKQEINTGLLFKFSAEEEELLTDESFFRMKQNISSLNIMLESRNMLFLPSRQEQWGANLLIGPFLGNGEIADSSGIGFIDTNSTPAGFRGEAGLNYTSRFYWNNNTYTLLDVSGWGRYDLYKNNAEGTFIDSTFKSSPYNDNSSDSKLRYGFKAKAGWGIGRINVVNHFAVAQWLLNKYYPGRIFSSDEVNAVGNEIGRIKHQRELRNGHSTEIESEQLVKFINEKLFLEQPDGLRYDWEYSELRPRFHGSRFEGGPFFNYFNREPDFVYGGFVKYENHKYRSTGINRLIGATLTYNGYKRDDWVTLEVTSGWSWYPSLKNELSFGLRYIPGMVVKDWDDLQPVNHALIPYLEFYTQMNSRYRIESSFAYRIAKKDEMVVPGPEFSVSFFRSKY